jgi:hypothetical protein
LEGDVHGCPAHGTKHLVTTSAAFQLSVGISSWLAQLISLSALLVGMLQAVLQV